MITTSSSLRHLAPQCCFEHTHKYDENSPRKMSPSKYHAAGGGCASSAVELIYIVADVSLVFNYLPQGHSFRDVFIVHHLSYSNWPDLSAPLDPKPTVTMIETARTLCNDQPIVVHCSAGIGQSVCFVGKRKNRFFVARVDYIRQKVKNNSDVKMVDILKELRNQRFQGVQGVIQYMFLHVCVLESFVHVRTFYFPKKPVTTSSLYLPNLIRLIALKKICTKWKVYCF
ncbi:unnamed protein product [Heligmosomoides polygyrus]|uniref:TYR_PHOSPHATASE_2 domain-containing protein n=1 Tax=Heligmosomoides polygyrus TaxID=6339 RepID=A0A183GXJ4_HELPZ|nr:unnamed protein product [Heligmosomoides polygyrus]